MENRIMETAKGIFSAKNLKRVGVVVALGAVLAGGAYWHHGQEVAAKERVSEARTQMVRTQADKAGLALLSENAVRTLVADAIGMDETAITYRRIDLTENRAKGMKHDDDKRKGAHRDGDYRDQKDKLERKDPPKAVHDRQMPTPDAPATQQTSPALAPDVQQPAAPALDAASPAPGTASVAPAPNRALFQPVYRVKCYANNVKYELILDAQSGAVLYREVDD